MDKFGTDMPFEAFLERYHPEAIANYKRYCGRRNHPTAGDKVRSLRAGFGGGTGQELQVICVDYNATYGHHQILLRNINDVCHNCNATYISLVSEWWRDLEKIE